MSIDESRIESVQAGAEEGRGRAGDQPPAPPTSPTSTGSIPRTSSAPPARPPRRCAANRTEPVRWRRPAGRRPQPIETAPGEVPAERKAELLRELRRARPRRGRARSPSSRPPTRRRAARSRSPTPRVCSAGDDRTRVRLGAQVVARRGDAVETGFETLGGHRGFELLDDDPARIADAGGRARRSRCSTPVPAPAGSMPVVVGGGFGGVLFHEMTGPRPRGRPHPEGRERLRRQARRAGRRAAAQRLRRRPPARRVGHRRHRRRGDARRRRPR